MGKLRTSILNLQKLLVDNPARQEKVEKELEGEIHNVNHIGQTADEGWNQLFIQLSSKFEDEGTTVDAMKSKTLKEVFDKSFVSTIKGIESSRQDIFRACAKFTTVYENGFGQMRADLAKAEEEAKALRAIAMKKKAKWLASTKYKDKIKGYLEVIDSVDQIIASQKKSLAGIKSYDQTWATKNFPALKLTMTVGEVKDRASMSTAASVKAYLGNLNGVNNEIRGLRGEYKTMAGQMASIKKMAEDADELEVIEDESSKKADPAKAAKLLGIRDADKLKKALEAQADGDEKTALKLLGELAKDEKRKDKADAMLKVLEKSGLL